MVFVIVILFPSFVVLRTTDCLVLLAIFFLFLVFCPTKFIRIPSDRYIR